MSVDPPWTGVLCDGQRDSLNITALGNCRPACTNAMIVDEGIGMSALQYLNTVLRLRCPRCQQGKMYRSPIQINDQCPHCGLSFHSEPGFFIGSLYPNYAMTVVLVAALYWLLVFGIGVHQTTSLWICIGFIALFPFWFHRYARCIWMLILQGSQNQSGNSNSAG